jgi:hypothetical protein
MAFSGNDPGSDDGLKRLLELGLTSTIGHWSNDDDAGKFAAFADYSKQLGLLPCAWRDGEAPTWTRTVSVPLSTGVKLAGSQ